MDYWDLSNTSSLAYWLNCSLFIVYLIHTEMEKLFFFSFFLSFCFVKLLEGVKYKYVLNLPESSNGKLASVETVTT